MDKKFSVQIKISATVLTAILLLSACASNKSDGNAAASQVARSNDILDLLTGFGESISKRNFERAVQYLTPEDRARMLDAQGHVPADKQKALMDLPLQRLIRTPSVRVENGYLAGIYDLIAREEAGAGLMNAHAADILDSGTAVNTSALIPSAGADTSSPTPSAVVDSAAALDSSLP